MSTPAKISDKYFRIPVVTTTERNAIGSPNTKMIIYNSTTDRFEKYNGSTWIGLSMSFVPIFKQGTAGGITNQANALQDLFNVTIGRRKDDLSKYSHFRLICRVQASSASVNNPRIFAEYSTDDVTYQSMGSSDLSMSSTGIKDSGWVAINSSAIADNIYYRVAQDGGDGVADPSLNYVYFLFR